MLRKKGRRKYDLRKGLILCGTEPLHIWWASAACECWASLGQSLISWPKVLSGKASTQAVCSRKPASLFHLEPGALEQQRLYLIRLIICNLTSFQRVKVNEHRAAINIRVIIKVMELFSLLLLFPSLPCAFSTLLLPICSNWSWSQTSLSMTGDDKREKKTASCLVCAGSRGRTVLSISGATRRPEAGNNALLWGNGLTQRRSWQPHWHCR